MIKQAATSADFVANLQYSGGKPYQIIEQMKQDAMNLKNSIDNAIADNGVLIQQLVSAVGAACTIIAGK